MLLKRLLQLVLCFGLLALTGCDRDNDSSGDFAIDDAYEKGPLAVHVRVDPNTISIAELLTLELEATIEEGYALRMPAIDQVLQQFGIVDWHNPGDRLGAENKRVKTLRYELEPFLSGDYELPPLIFNFHDVNDPNKVYTLETDPIPVTVTSLLDEERADLTISDIESVVAVPRPPLPWWYWLVAWFILLGMLGVIILLVRRKKVGAIIRILKPAHEVAYARLQVLVDRNLIDQGQIKIFYEEISHILRHYIEDRFQLHAPERTTEEFLYELQHSDALTGDDQDTLRSFLQHCDLVKFAKHEPTNEEIQRTFDLVKAFIEKTRSDQHQIDVTDRVVNQSIPENQEVPA